MREGEGEDLRSGGVVGDVRVEVAAGVEGGKGGEGEGVGCCEGAKGCEDTEGGEADCDVCFGSGPRGSACWVLGLFE